MKPITTLCIMIPLATILLSFPCQSQTFEGTHLSNITPSYAMPPFVYENNRMVLITFKTSPHVIRALVPELLSINQDSLMTIYVGAMNLIDPKQITYYEAGIMIPAAYGDIKGSYMPVLYLDKALPIIIGREIWGFPKFQADFNFVVKDGIVQASVVMEGVTLIDATLHLGKPILPKVSPPSSFFLMKSIPSAKGNSTYDVKQLTTAVIRDLMNSEVYPGEATLRLGSTVSDPLGMIPVVEIVSGVYTIGRFVLDYGEVVYDYREKPRASENVSPK